MPSSRPKPRSGPRSSKPPASRPSEACRRFHSTAPSPWPPIFAAQYRLKALARRGAGVWSGIDCMLLPTAPTLHSIQTMLAKPIARNSDFRCHTNFVNLLDYSAIAVPASFRPDCLPCGVTFVAQAHQDQPLLHLAQRWQRARRGRAATPGATGHAAVPWNATRAVASGQIRVAVCGAHLEGQPLSAMADSAGEGVAPKLFGQESAYRCGAEFLLP